MGYLSAEEFESFGLSAQTPESLVEAASALMNAHCRRETLDIAQYTERLRVSTSHRVRLTYLPLPSGIGAVVSARARYGMSARDCSALGAEVASAFRLLGAWADLDPSALDVCCETGEVWLGVSALGWRFDEVQITYKAGLDSIPDAVKHACAMVVRNAQSTPALNVRRSSVDRMQMEYFSDALLDTNVKKLLAPYVAQKVG